MGCLDPKIDKQRVKELLEKKGAFGADVLFNGGHDQGDVESITLHKSGGETEDLVVWYCGGYRFNPEGGYIRLNEPANEDEELSELLQGPIDATFSTWGSVPSTYGVLEWRVQADDVSAQMQYTQDVETEFVEAF
jgi:hypothetical protein